MVCAKITNDKVFHITNGDNELRTSQKINLSKTNTPTKNSNSTKINKTSHRVKIVKNNNQQKYTSTSISIVDYANALVEICKNNIINHNKGYPITVSEIRQMIMEFILGFFISAYICGFGLTERIKYSFSKVFLLDSWNSSLVIEKIKNNYFTLTLLSFLIWAIEKQIEVLLLFRNCMGLAKFKFSKEQTNLELITSDKVKITNNNETFSSFLNIANEQSKVINKVNIPDDIEKQKFNKNSKVRRYRFKKKNTKKSRDFTKTNDKKSQMLANREKIVSNTKIVTYNSVDSKNMINSDHNNTDNSIKNYTQKGQNLNKNPNDFDLDYISTSESDSELVTFNTIEKKDEQLKNDFFYDSTHMDNNTQPTNFKSLPNLEIEDLLVYSADKFMTQQRFIQNNKNDALSQNFNKLIYKEFLKNSPNSTLNEKSIFNSSRNRLTVGLRNNDKNSCLKLSFYTLTDFLVFRKLKIIN